MSIKANCSFQLWYLSLTWWSYKLMKSVIERCHHYRNFSSLTHKSVCARADARTHPYKLTHSTLLLTVCGNIHSYSLTWHQKVCWFTWIRKTHTHIAQLLVDVMFICLLWLSLPLLHFPVFQALLTISNRGACTHTHSEKDQSERHSI